MDYYKNIISENLKHLRSQRKLSLDKVAALTNISKSMLSQIEKGTANPSVSTLVKLSNGFKISFTELMNAPEKEIELIKLSNIEPLVEKDGHFRNYPIILFDPIKRFETYKIEIDSNIYYKAEPHLAGTHEYITVIDGNITINTNKDTYQLIKGDTIRFKADTEHSYYNESDTQCTIHMILYYPPK